MQMSKIWTTSNIFRFFFFAYSLNHFFQLKEGPGFIKYYTMKFLKEMLIRMTG